MKKHVSLIAVLLVVALVVTPMGASARFSNITEGGVVSKNINRHNYYFEGWIKGEGYLCESNFGAPANSVIYSNTDGTISRYEYVTTATESYLMKEEYSSDFQYVKDSFVRTDIELPIYGCVYVNDENVYVMSGQDNKAGTVGVNEYCLTKYTRDLQLIKSCYMTNTNTYQSIIASGCQLKEWNGELIAISSHTMHAGADGLNHQTSIMFEVNMETMTLTDDNVDRGGMNVSHSMDCYLTLHNDELYSLQLSDGYPERGVMLMKSLKVDSKKYVSSKASYDNVFPIGGDAGANFTGVSLGGLESSSTNILAAFNAGNWNSSPKDFYSRNVFLSVSSSGKGETAIDNKTTQITNYTKTSYKTASNPQLINLKNDTFMLMWEEQIRYDEDKWGMFTGTHTNRIKYCYLDNKGEMLSDIREVTGQVSDCQPIVYQGSVVWYTTDNSTPTFYKLPTDKDSELEYAKDGEQLEADGLVYEIISNKDRTAKVVGTTSGLSKNATIRSAITIDTRAYTVVSINKGIFDESNIESISIPNTITSMDSQIIAKCVPTIKTVSNQSLCSVDLPVSTNKTGKILLYWYTNKDTTVTSVDQNTGLTGLATAVYKTGITVTYNDKCDPATITTTTAYTGEKLTKPKDPVRAGYTFLGWSKNNSSSNLFSFVSYVLYSDTTLYAQWRVKYGSTPTTTTTTSNVSKKPTSNTSSTTTEQPATSKTLVTKLGKAVISSCKSNGKKKLSLGLMKISNATGYQIQISTKSSFQSAKKYTTTTVSKTITKLKSKKKYYVRVRAYRQVGNKILYGSWSNKKKIKVK